ncbi:dienelactone hydrolase family protein [Pelomonas sp. APW6]|uniref:Dienelactone hydrolase family protein n=1 Tax=Roseateles subflavus TaxID=3053353 RepID=A0ABT7LFK4_9BURK|nr:dienelactone hydrolase family protein [Pelomonas sp. APW6]MDL5031239.1 dienelactone hydrolase family protein [Pelomonas sp. APW6]
MNLPSTGAPAAAPRLRASDFSPGILRLFDRYVHGDVSRREFLDAAQRLLGSAAAATATLAALSPSFASAQQVKPDDPRISTRRQRFDSPAGHGTVRGLLAAPAQARGPLPTVLVVHENRGLNPHIEDIARRLAVEGFLAFAPDALDSLGGYPGDEDRARELFPKLEPAKVRADFIAAAQAIRALPQSNGRLGVVGFCFGGSIANFLATQLPELQVAVPFYGSQPPVEDVPRIQAELLLHYAGQDERINAGWPRYEAALRAAGVRYEAHVYEGTQHGFNNDTTPRFDAQAAALAWERTLALFRARLG